MQVCSFIKIPEKKVKNQKIATKTVTYKNIKKYAKKKVTITIKTKKKPDFVNYSAGWGTSNVSTKWGW